MAPVNPEPYALRKEDLPELVAQNPLAWLVSVDCEEVAVRPRSDGDGRLVSLVGHFARRNRHLDLLRRQPRVAILTLGPNASISPSWLEDRQPRSRLPR
jgi:transcriptional regulator